MNNLFRLAFRVKAAGEALLALGLIWFHPEDVVPVEKIDPFLLAFADSGVEYYNELAFGFSEEIGKAPARTDVDVAPESAAVSHRDRYPLGVHFSHRFHPFESRRP